MRKIGSLLASALLVVAVGCGSDGGTKSNDAGRLDGGATPGVDGGNVNPGVDGSVTPVVDAPVSPDAPAVIDAATVDNSGGGVVIDGKGIDSKGIDGGKLDTAVDGAKALDGGSVNPGIDGGAAVACNMPTCMAAVAQDCVPSGTCVTQTDTATATTSTCYTNGVKTVQQTGATGITVTAKNTTGVCYSMAIDLASIIAAAAGGAINVPVKNGAGAVIATLSVDSASQQTSVTCPGGQPVLLNSGCTGAVSINTSGGASSNCTAGTCAP